jgi:hypothetical protein
MAVQYAKQRLMDASLRQAEYANKTRKDIHFDDQMKLVTKLDCQQWIYYVCQAASQICWAMQPALYIQVINPAVGGI